MAKRVAIDIGSTIVKVAQIGHDGQLLDQCFHKRNFELGIERQGQTILEQHANGAEVFLCSSANGGLRVGIVCLTKLYSGATLRNQVLLSGANPIYVHDLEEASGDLRPVDVLLLGGGVDCEDTNPLMERLARFDGERYRYGTLVYAGNKHLADSVAERYPDAVVVDNPLADGLRERSLSVSRVLRDAYLDDLIHKDGISQLQSRVSGPIRPTPEVVNRGFHRVVSNRSDLKVGGPSVLIDIGGATTDVHYTVEIVRDDSAHRPAAGSSVGRYVFTDLGVFASRDTVLLQLRTHPRLFEFLDQVLDGDVSETYRLLREGEDDPSVELLSYACLFLCLDRFTDGKGPGLPAANLDKVTQIILTGGASQGLAKTIVQGVVGLFVSDERNWPAILVDERYRIWAEGITWSHIPQWAE